MIISNIFYYTDRLLRATAFILLSIPLFLLIIVIPLIIKGERRETFSEAFTKLWYRLLFACFGIRLEVEGNFNENSKFLIYANHLSFLDIPAITLAFAKKRVKFLAKEEIFSMPIIGWGMKIQGHINVSKISSIRKVLSIMRKGNTDAICIFPEGTRQKISEGLKELMQFKEGISFMIENLSLPVYPVAIIGTQRILPVSAAIPRSGKIKVIIGSKLNPLEIISKAPQDRKERRIIVSESLKNYLEQIIEKNL